MTYKVKMSFQAKKDIRSIYRYIAFQLKEPQIAAKQYERIKSEIRKLNEMPERHAYYPDEPWRSYGVKKLIVDNYIALYIIDSKANIVVVLRIPREITSRFGVSYLLNQDILQDGRMRVVVKDVRAEEDEDVVTWLDPEQLTMF